MIQANELRIGNLFQDADGTFCYYAGSWQRQDGWIHRDSASNTYKDKEMYPIPLTPEILEACGFTNRHPEGNLWDNGYILKSMRDGKDIEKSFCVAAFTDYYVAIMANHTHFRFLHQLQNLYYSLTGQELNYQP